jgi:hypothetical protein
LPDATALSGGERLPAVQAGQTVGATIDQIRAGLLPAGHAGSGGAVHAPAEAGGAAGFLSGADKAKLDGLPAQAAPLQSPVFQTSLTLATDGGPAVCYQDSYAETNGSIQVLRRARGTMAAPQAVLANDRLAAWTVSGHDGSTFVNPVILDFSAAARGSYVSLGVTPTGSTTRIEALRVEPSGVGRPGADAAHSWGTGAYRFTEVYAVTGVINTSDERDKELISPADPALAAALVRAIDPVTFKWRDVERPAVVETRRIIRQKTQPVTVARDVIERAGDIFVRRRIEETVETPMFSEYPLHDETGAPLLDGEGRPILHREPVLEEIDEEVIAAPAYTKVNRRTHWGFVAQQVEAGLCGALGLNRDDPTQLNAARLRFAGLIHDGASDKYGLRDGQFTPILWAVLRDVLGRVEALEAGLPA